MVSDGPSLRGFAPPPRCFAPPPWLGPAATKVLRSTFQHLMKIRDNQGNCLCGPFCRNAHHSWNSWDSLLGGNGVGGNRGSVTAGCPSARDRQTPYRQRDATSLSCSRKTEAAQHLHDSTVSLSRWPTTSDRHVKSAQKPFPPISVPPLKECRNSTQSRQPPPRPNPESLKNVHQFDPFRSVSGLFRSNSVRFGRLLASPEVLGGVVERGFCKENNITNLAHLLIYQAQKTNPNPNF